MKKKRIKNNIALKLMAIAFSIVFGFFISQDTFANDWISISISPICDLEGCSDCCGCHSDDSRQRFSVGYSWKSNCNGTTHYENCNMLSHDTVGYCHNPGKPCPSSSNVSLGVSCSNVAVGKGDAHKNVCTYDGSISGGGSSYQNVYMDGKFERMPKKFTLTIKSRITGTEKTLKYVTNLGDRAETVYYGDKTELSRGYTNTGFLFDYLSDGISGDVVRKKIGEDTTVYAYYHGDSDTSSTGITVKNNRLGGSPSSSVYAKPNDSLTFNATYSPGAQRGANYVPQYVKIDSGEICGNNNKTLTTRQLFNHCNPSGTGNWKNAYAVTKDNFKVGTEPLKYTGEVGNASAMSNSNNHTVDVKEAGHELIEHSRTNAFSDQQTTPKSFEVKRTSSTKESVIVVKTTPLDASAKAVIPYNFINHPDKPRTPDDDPNDDGGDDYPKTDEELIERNKIVYAGEEDTFNYTLDVNKRKNNVTKDEYATIVRDARWRLELCYANECNSGHYSYSVERSGTLNESGSTEGEQNKEEKDHKINIPDRYAGSRVCVRVAVYPKDSGSDTNISTSYYNVNDPNSWAYSNRSCYIIAKRPSTQVWGGNVYSRANLETSTAVKNNLNGYSKYAYNAKDKKGTFIFGSWGELGVVANGTVSGFGSGASMGYLSNNGGSSTWPSYTHKGTDGTTFSYNGLGNVPNGKEPGGSSNGNFCNRVPLTIPNASCSGNLIGTGLSSAVGVTQASNDKKSIIDTLGVTGTEVSGNIDAGRIGNISGNETKVFGTKTGDITITSDLIYFDKEGVYHSYHDMPKLIIYAKNIKINCNVERIDALLIADGEVQTCADSNNLNDRMNSRQLFVNGAIIANKLTATRTYGAATGANSIIPAEIINFDPTLYEFGNSALDDDDVAGRLDASYTHELAPRL